ncbi:MAG: C-GCAxxG-C-C family protein, partial [candidate division KSB1 bacterium]|nr:C-GCAxxG-C-C family protein [candidate division KSB1 bacterium]
MKKNELIEKARSRFLRGYNCAESVWGTLLEVWGQDRDVFLPLTTPFGGGMGLRGSVCGAISGGLMALGLKYGRTQPDQDKEKVYQLALEFYHQFEKTFGSALCYDLIKIDLADPEARKTYEALNLREEKCV